MNVGLWMVAALAVATMMSASTLWHLLVRPSAVPGVDADADVMSPRTLRALRVVTAVLVGILAFALGFVVSLVRPVS